MLSLLKTKELQKITGGWECLCSRPYGRYVFMSENSCKQLCCQDVLVDFYKLHEIKFCSAEAQIAAQPTLKKMALMKYLKDNSLESLDDFRVIM